MNSHILQIKEVHITGSSGWTDMREISRYATSDTNDTPVYITIGIVAVLALAILMISYVKKD